jgi:uncharacterized RDD family membrane protein YckC
MEQNLETAPAAPEPTAGLTLTPGGFWLRVGALTIDYSILSIGGVISLTAPAVVAVPARLLITVAYFTVLPVVWKGRTVGKAAAGLAVCRQNGEAIGYGRAFVRWLGYLVDGLSLGIGFLLAAFTENKRGLHDYIADTRVVQVEDIGFGRKVAVIAAGVALPSIAVLGIIAAIAIPQFGHAVDRENEGISNANLGSVRSALSLYSGDKGGAYPSDLHDLVPKYVPQIPALKLSRGSDTSDVEYYDDDVCGGTNESGLDAAKLHGSGKWGYVRPRPGLKPNDAKKSCVGRFFIDSAQTDSKGKIWNTY